jgi:hypothetical protein
MDLRGINRQRLSASQDHAAVSGMQCPPVTPPGEIVKSFAIFRSRAVRLLRTSCAALKPHVAIQIILDKMMPAVRLIIPCICPYINKVVAGNLHGWREIWESSFITKHFPLFKYRCVFGVLRSLRVQKDGV